MEAEIWGVLRVGQIITTYNKGYWRIIKIERRFKNNGMEINPLIHYEFIANDAGVVKKSKRKECCDYAYCRDAKESIQAKLEELKVTMQNLAMLEATIQNYYLKSINLGTSRFRQGKEK